MNADTPGRLDELVARALQAGEVPAEATAAEREEILRLLGPAMGLREVARQLADEAAESRPVARARFERFLDQARRPAPVDAVAASRRGWFAPVAGLFAAHRAAALGAAAGAAVLVVVALLAANSFFNGVDSAAAMVLHEDDYVQIEGVVTAADGQEVRIASEFAGDLTVVLDPSTSIVDGQQSRSPGDLAPGTAVLVDGVVAKGLDVRASTIALGARQQAAPRRVTVRELKSARPDLTGTVASIALSPDGKRLRVLLETPSGEHLVVVTSAEASERLLALTSALGATVEVTGSAGQPFVVEPRTGAGPNPPGLPCVDPPTTRVRLTGVCGVITAIDRNVLTVTGRGGATTRVVIGPDTRILLGRSGLLRERLLEGRTAIGHTLAATGRLEPGTGRILAGLVILGPRPAP